MFFKGAGTNKKLEAIPIGHYHEVMETGHPVRRAWHRLKFTRVLECLPNGPDQSILDIGCFAGTFLSLLPESRFTRQVGVDILPDQIDYANRHFGNKARSFVHTPTVDDISSRVDGLFDYVTLIEVIEHLTPAEIDRVLGQAAKKLKPGGHLVLSTPNYASAWPALELLLNRVSDVSYDEQHITRFTYFNCEKKLRQLSPQLRDSFDLEFKTTTHLLTPFLAVFGVDRACQMSSAIDHRSWKVPFGNLVLVSFVRR